MSALADVTLILDSGSGARSCPDLQKYYTIISNRMMDSLSEEIIPD
jgi:hypothetical protein